MGRLEGQRIFRAKKIGKSQRPESASRAVQKMPAVADE